MGCGCLFYALLAVGAFFAMAAEGSPSGVRIAAFLILAFAVFKLSGLRKRAGGQPRWPTQRRTPSTPDPRQASLQLRREQREVEGAQQIVRSWGEAIREDAERARDVYEQDRRRDDWLRDDRRRDDY